MKYLIFVLYIFIFMVSSATSRTSTLQTSVSTKQVKNQRIIGGQEAFVGEFPSAAAIYVTATDGTYFCGGSLVSNQFILTAAHCIIVGWKYDTILGSNRLQGTDPNRVIASTGSRIVHPYFNYQTLQNDIALLMFHMPIELSEYIQPINLPTEDLLVSGVTTAIGWGQTSDAVGGLASTLQYVTVSAIPNPECQVRFTNTIYDNMVCVVGNYNEGTCNGDSGSPLIATIDGKQYHVGISSFISTNGCESLDPSGFTRTLPYAGWVAGYAGIN